MKLLKRIVSVLCSVALLSSTVIGASATSSPLISDISTKDGYDTEIEWKSDKDFVVTGYLDGVVHETVQGSVGSDELLVTDYGSMKQSASQMINASSIITKAKDSGKLPPSEEFLPMMPLAAESYAGYLTYRIPNSSGGYQYPSLYAYYENVGSYYMNDYKLDTGIGTSISVIMGAILAVTGVAMGAGVVKALVRFWGGVVIGNMASGGIEGTFKGTKYDLNTHIKDKKVSPTKVESFSGMAFDGVAKQGNGAWLSFKGYDGIYPQFIREMDTVVAATVFYSFFDGNPYVTTWSSAI